MAKNVKLYALCGGGSICSHGRRKYNCKDCKGNSICEHNNIKYKMF